MTIFDGVREVMGEMIRLQELLRHTSPSHKMSQEEERLFAESIGKAEEALKRVAGEASPH